VPSTLANILRSDTFKFATSSSRSNAVWGVVLGLVGMAIYMCRRLVESRGKNRMTSGNASPSVSASASAGEDEEEP